MAPQVSLLNRSKDLTCSRRAGVSRWKSRARSDWRCDAVTDTRRVIARWTVSECDRWTADIATRRSALLIWRTRCVATWRLWRCISHAIIIIIITTLFPSQSNRYEGQQAGTYHIIQNQCWHAGQNNQSQTTRFSTGISCQHKRR